MSLACVGVGLFLKDVLFVDLSLKLFFSLFLLLDWPKPD